MKIFIRSFALALVATGAVATLHASTSSATMTTAGKITAPPVPMCPPGEPGGCGLYDFGK